MSGYFINDDQASSALAYSGGRPRRSPLHLVHDLGRTLGGRAQQRVAVRRDLRGAAGGGGDDDAGPVEACPEAGEAHLSPVLVVQGDVCDPQIRSELDEAEDEPLAQRLLGALEA